MINTTEMPEKIYIYPDTKRVVRSWCGVRKFSEDVPYIRKDAIPSKAEVARELQREINQRAGEKIDKGMPVDAAHCDSLLEVLKEWEDAESIQNKTESDSPALSYQSEHYPSSWHGKVPRRVRLTTRVWSDFPFKFLEVEKGVEVPVWVNSHGAVAAILPNGDTLGLKP